MNRKSHLNYKLKGAGFPKFHLKEKLGKFDTKPNFELKKQPQYAEKVDFWAQNEYF